METGPGRGRAGLWSRQRVMDGVCICMVSGNWMYRGGGDQRGRKISLKVYGSRWKKMKKR